MLENLTYETVSGDIKIDNNKYTSSNKEITTSQTENKKSTDLRNIEATDFVKREELNFKGIMDVVRPDDNKDTTANTVFNSGVNRISEIKINSAYESGARDLKTEYPISEENSDNVKPSVNKNIISFTGLSLDATPISSEEKIDAARGISFTTSTDEFREFSLEQSAEFATNEADYSDSNSEKDSMSRRNCSLKFKEESFYGEKAILVFGNQNATDTLKIKNLNLGTSFDSSKSIDDEDSISNTIINRGLVLTSLGENKTVDLVNSTVSSIKQPENSSSISAAKFVDPDVHKDTTYSGFNLVTQENASEKISDSTLENSSTVNSVNLEGFTSTTAVNDISTAKDKTFKKEIMLTTSSEEKTSIPLSDPSGKSPLKLEALETNGKSSDDDKTVSNKDTISNSERFNFGLKSNSSGEKSPTDSKNSLISSNKELGNLFSKFDSDRVKADLNKSITSVSECSFGIKPTLLEEKSAVDLENLAASDEPKKSSLVSHGNNSLISSTKEDVNLFSRLASDGAIPDTNKSVAPNFSFSFGIKSPLILEKSDIPLEKSAIPFEKSALPFVKSALPFEKSALPFEKSAIPLENLAASNAIEPESSALLLDKKNSTPSSSKEDVSLFSSLYSDGTKPDANKSSTPNFNRSFGIEPTLFSEKSSIALENSAGSNDVKPKSSSLVSDGENSLTLSNKKDGSLFSRLVSDGAKPDTNKNITPNYNYSFGKTPTSLEEISQALYAIEPKISSFVSGGKNLSNSSTKEHGNIFSRLPSNGAKSDTNKSVFPNSNFSFGIKPPLVLEKPVIPLENSVASNAVESKSSPLASNEKNSSTSSTKEDGKLFSTLASDGDKSAENKSTTPNFTFNFGKPSTPMEEKLPALYAIEPKISSFVPDAKNLSTSSTKEHGSTFSRLPSNCAKPDANKSVSPNFSFGIKPALFSEKAAIPFENLAASNAIESKSSSFVSNEKNSSTSSAKEDGKLFSTLVSDGAKSAENKSTTPNFTFYFGIKPALFSEKSAIGLANSAALSSLEPKSSSLVSGIQSSPTTSTEKLGGPFSKIASDGSKTDLNKNTTHNFDFRAPWNNFKCGPRRSQKAVRKIIKEKTSGSTSTVFTFGSMNASEKSEQTIPGSTSTGFTFTFSYPKFQEKTSRITSTDFISRSLDARSHGPGTPFKFSPVIGTDTIIRGGVPTNISTRHQYITSMEGYLSKSFEELRLEDYKWGEKVWNYTDPILQKGGLSFPNSNSAFENTSTARSNLTFGATETSGVSELLKGLEELLHSGKHSDVTLTVQDKKFNAHRVILGIRSPVFSAMMEHETKEKATGVVNIPDCDPDPFFDFLHFLYTGSTKKVKADNVLDLYTIADKYQVPELCKICVNYMKSNITLQNFCDILTLSLRHHERELTDVATQFFLKNSTEIALTVSWSLFVKENPVAANELFLKALNLYKK